MRFQLRVRYLLAPLALCALMLTACGEQPTSVTREQVQSGGEAAAVVALPFRQIANGSSYNCGLTADGVIYCWGVNNLGQLGDGTFTSRSTPRPIPGSRRYRQITGGGGHVCAVAINDRAYCWGANATGELGDGTRADRTKSTAVLGGLRFRLLSAGLFHTCGVTLDDRAYCWGTNKQGQLGDGTDEPRRLQPVAVAGTRRFRVVSAGASHTCGINLDGKAFCWGHGKSGEIGDGTTSVRRTPRAVSGGLTFSDISTGLAAQSGNYNFTCGVTTSDRAYCWGGNIDGQLGDGTTARRLRPVAVTGGLRFASVSARMGYACGLTTADAAWCWGRDDHGQLGDGGPTSGSPSRPFPTAVSGNLSFTTVRSGWLHACALTPEDAAYCWGSNLSGELADGIDTGSSTPVRIVADD